MKTMLACLAIYATLVGSALAEVRYDRKLEAAVKARVAAKIGDIRAGFDYGKAAQFVRTPDPMVTGSVVQERSAENKSVLIDARGSLSFPIERRVSRRVF
jgi:hypothetical protein